MPSTQVRDSLPRFVPRSLYRQLLLFTSLALGLSILAFGALSAQRQSQQAISRLNTEMTLLAQTLAVVSSNDVETNNKTEIDRLGGLSVRFPDVVAITFYNSDGAVLSQQTPQAIAAVSSLSTQQTALPLRNDTFIEGSSDALGYITDSSATLHAWSPIQDDKLNGWVRVSYRLAEVKHSIVQIWQDALLFSVLTILLTILVMMLLLHKPIKALRAATLFAEQLDKNHGSKMPVSHQTSELKSLTEALNNASERLHRQQIELYEAAEQRRGVLDNVLDAIITIDGSGIIKTFNLAATKIFGYSEQDVIGKNVNILMPEPYHSAHDGFIHNYLNTGNAKIIGTGREVEGKRKDGSIFPMDLAVSHSVQLGQPMFIGLVRDISERKRMEQLKSEFVSTVSHELRTPITSISGALELVKSGVLGELPEKTKPLINIAAMNSTHLSNLIDDLLDMEKLIAGKMRFTLVKQPVMPLIENTLMSVVSYGDKYNVKFEITKRDDSLQVEVDEKRFHQVLSNLLSNAAKFSQPNTNVDIAVQQVDDTVEISVTDYGQGIAEEFQSRIFQKFSQADATDSRSKGGTGLGLAISKDMMNRMQGDLLFSSVPGQGATFVMRLPRVTLVPAQL
ncbi:MAG TPA: ATP-binding protein [Rheinheimera sp.]|nr:ATP-binding protein [Rheinheimera sp.]